MREGVLDLADGRRLAYAEWGPADAPAGLYCHGHPGSRRQLLLSEPELARAHVSARLIALNRPGYGPSTFKPRYRLLDWPADVEEGLHKLGGGRTAVIGASGGCPFALACRHELGDRVSRISIVVGTSPLEAPGMSEAPGVANIPTSPTLRRLQYCGVALASRTKLADRLVGWIHRDLGDADRRGFQGPEARAWFLGVLDEAFAGAGRGAAGEARLYLEPWGFDPADVTTKTLLWYGGEDITVPAAAGRWLAKRLPRSRYTLWPQHGHFSWAVSGEVVDVIEATVATDRKA